MFPPGLANLKRNLGMGSIPLKSIVIFIQAQRAVELSTTGSRCRSESAGTDSTVRSNLYLANRIPTDDPIYCVTCDRYAWALRKSEYSMLDSSSWMGYGSLWYYRYYSRFGQNQSSWPSMETRKV